MLLGPCCETLAQGPLGLSGNPAQMRIWDACSSDKHYKDMFQIVIVLFDTDQSGDVRYAKCSVGWVWFDCAKCSDMQSAVWGCKCKDSHILIGLFRKQITIGVSL